MLEMPISEAASFTLIVPRSTWLSQSGRSFVAFQAQPAHEGGVAADHDHGQEVGDHRNVHEREDPEHENRFRQLANVKDHVPQFGQELVGIEQLRHDQAGIERRLDPAAGEDDDLEPVLDAADAPPGPTGAMDAGTGWAMFDIDPP